ncbi:retrovirus-related pol polyprotein from transposon TNT 1-94 [Tanacetum coccineum]
MWILLQGIKNDNQTGQFGNQRAVNVVGARETVVSKCANIVLGYSVLTARNLVIMLRNAESQNGLKTPRITRKRCTIRGLTIMCIANDIQHFDQSESISNTCAVETDDSNVTPDSPDMCDNDIQDDQNDVECDDERVALANLIANLKLDVDENKKIQKQLKKANATLTQELTECKSILAETSRTLGESNSIRDSCLVALQNKQTEFERYKAFNDRTVDYDKLEHKLNEALGLIAQKEINIKEGLKVKAYEISVVKEKHDELEREQYFAIQDLKAQLQDKNIAINVNARTKKPNRVPISTRKPKSQANKSVATPHKKTVASESIITNSKNYYRMLYKKTNKAWKWWIAQQCPSAYTWVPKTKRKWVPKVRNEVKPVVLAMINLLQFLVMEIWFKEISRSKRVYLRRRDLQGNDLLTDNRGTDLYTISLQETTSSAPICLMAKASPTQSWLWHRRLSHLNFDYINLLSKKDVVIGLPKLKYVKDQMMCPLVKYTWTLFLRSKDETPEVLKDFLTMIQRNLQALVISVRTDRGTEFLNKTLHVFFKEEGIEHQTSTPRTLEQNGVVERQNRTLIEAARTMPSASKLPLFFWAEAIATACYTQNRSIIIPTHEKIAYHIINDRKPSIKHLHIFGCTCYLTRDGENLDKMKEKGDPCILVGYSTQSKGYRVYNQRTNYDKPDPAPELQNSSSLADTIVPSQQELDLLFGPLYDEFFNDGTSRVNKSSSPTDNSIQKDTLPSTHIQPTSETTTLTNVHAEENNDN